MCVLVVSDNVNVLGLSNVVELNVEDMLSVGEVSGFK